MIRLLIGTKIRHDFSRTTGIITAYRRDPQGYNYQVQWDDKGSKIDWYKRNVLELV
jgi:hypothetical protein